MPTRRHLLCALPAIWLSMAFTPARAQTTALPAALGKPGTLLVLRHARAPGVGDPDHFKPGDCATQRNLDAEGRSQAKLLGERLKAAGFRPTFIASSAWCRCQDTAQLMNLGPVRTEPLLNSFFNADRATRDAQMQKLSRYIDGLDPRGGPYLFVTHQVVITALTGHNAESAGGVLIELPAKGDVKKATEFPALTS
ncbi:histidine phosphatase family protein [Cupriavidus sp. SW-Y-13]|uniref:histidine phosphatase family protein n=1 Tax=Cupriavidus sp. SW-Y-13 TaxID=2653854 RepID=UPI00136594FC|nr:histidine phosphatase family protein [Cupriavidus sp. SW-Y-13]MWL89752.1 histidine phosphatase family protein [Cupriavidus sp. SW-Y-13]